MKRLIVGLVVVVALSWASDEAAAESFFDNFNDGNADGWVFLEFDTRGPGEWSVENQTLTRISQVVLFRLAWDLRQTPGI